MSKHVIHLLTTACVALPLLPPAAKAELIAVASISTVLSIDEATGQGTRIGYTGQYANPRGLALDAAGILYFVGWSLGSEQDHLVTLDLAKGTLDGGPVVGMRVRGLAFSPSGTLFAIGDRGVAPDRLYTIDVNTGATALIGDTGLPEITALDFSSNGTLYAWDAGDSLGMGGLGLVTIDPVTGLATDVEPAVGGSYEVEGLAFVPDGTLYGAGKNLYTVDVQTGGLALVGPIGVVSSGVSAIVFVPEPSTLASLLSVGTVAVLLCASRKRKRAVSA